MKRLYYFDRSHFLHLSNLIKPFSYFKEQFTDINNIEFSLKKNGKTVQNGNSMLMMWKIDALIEYISKYFTLKIGDVIFTGTPAGVGSVKADDVLTGYIGKTEMFSIKVK